MTFQQTIMSKLYGRNIWDGFSPGESDLQGWHGDHPSLPWLITTAKIPLVVDVGVWKGQSTIHMARAMKEAGLDGCVIAVDTFLGSAEHWEKGYFARTHGLPDLYWTFLSNVHAAGLAEYVVPFPQNSIAAATILREREIAPGLVHLDAGHEYEEVIREAEMYYSLLPTAGFLVGDDYHHTWPGVQRAADEFSTRHQLELIINDPKWIVRKSPDRSHGLRGMFRRLISPRKKIISAAAPNRRRP